jgi:hypothetical protein
LPVTNGAGAAAAAAAIARMREEEESMTPYTAEDLARYEFKFLRSNTGAFGSREKLRRALEDEAVAGWQLVEKFDNSRLRLKRPLAAREHDAQLSFDPYRTNYGMNQAAFIALLVGSIFVFIGALILIAKLIADRTAH